MVPHLPVRATVGRARARGARTVDGGGAACGPSRCRRQHGARLPQAPPERAARAARSQALRWALTLALALAPLLSPVCAQADESQQPQSDTVLIALVDNQGSRELVARVEAELLALGFRVHRLERLRREPLPA